MKIFVVGSINMDMVMHTPYIPESGETIEGSHFMVNPGGKGANQAVAIAKTTKETYMVGALGRAFGNDLSTTLDKYHVKTELIKHLDFVSSGTAIILISDGDNRIIIDAGSNHFVSKEDVDQAFMHANAEDFVVLQMELPIETIEYTLKKAKQKGMTTILNTAPAKKIGDDLFNHVDYLILNQTECEFYTNVLPKDKDDVLVPAKTLLEKGAKQVIITLGTKGSVYINKNEEMIYVPSFKVKAIDTTAAGDTYIGYFVSMIGKNHSIKEAMTYASAAAALTVTKLGAQQSIPDMVDVEEFIRRWLI